MPCIFFLTESTDSVDIYCTHPFKNKTIPQSLRVVILTTYNKEIQDDPDKTLLKQYNPEKTSVFIQVICYLNVKERQFSFVLKPIFHEVNKNLC